MRTLNIFKSKEDKKSLIHFIHDYKFVKVIIIESNGH